MDIRMFIFIYNISNRYIDKCLSYLRNFGIFKDYFIVNAYFIVYLGIFLKTFICTNFLF